MDAPVKLPLISVIMPAYNGEKFIEEAIRSVMNQTFTDWELLVIDDGSTDSTCTVVERLAAEDERVTLICNEVNMGVARTRNRGFDLCKGQYVALLDSDDVWFPEKLEFQLARIRRTGADLAYCSYGLLDADENRVKSNYVVPEHVTYGALLKENVIGCSTVMLTEAIVKKYRFDTEFYHEDYVLWLQLLKDGYTATGCTDVLVNWRFVEKSRSFDKKKSAHNRWKIYRDYLEMPFWKSIWVFGAYAAASLKKYRG